jgi:hypothetical protein
MERLHPVLIITIHFRSNLEQILARMVVVGTIGSCYCLYIRKPTPIPKTKNNQALGFEVGYGGEGVY